jgi:PAS domain S-box-containing protein
METPKSGRLLVVEDDRELMASLCEAMANHGYETLGVTSGEDAIEALKQQNFDLLLTDLVMPDMDGIALLREGLAVDPHLVGIIMTEQGTVETAVDAMKVGAFDYILKPLNLKDLLRLLSRAMEVRQLRLGDVKLRQGMAVQGLFEAISYLHDSSAILNKAADAALEQCEADEASVMVPVPERDELCVVVARGEGRWNLLGERIPIDKGVAGWVARHREPLTLHGEVKKEGAAPVKPRADIRSAISMPMLVGGKLTGVLNVNATQRRRPFSLGQVKALNILASIAAAGSEGAQLYTRMRAAEEKFRSIFVNSVKGIFQSSPEGRYITANPSLARIFRHNSPDELIAAITDIQRQIYVDPNRYAEFTSLLEKSDNLVDFEFQAYRKDGSIAWLSQNARAVRDEHGMLRCYEGTVQDISERKRSETHNAVQLAVNRTLAESADLRVAGPLLLQALCETLQWKLGAIWLVDKDANVLRYESIWHPPQADFEEFVAVSQKMTFPPGIGLPGRVWAKGKVAWIPDVTTDSNFPQAPVAAKVGLHGAVGFPIKIGDKTVGIFEFFSDQIYQPDHELLELMGDIGIKIGQFVERRQAAEELSRMESKYRTLVESIPGIIYAADLNGSTTYVSPQIEKLLGFSPAEWLADPQYRIKQLHPDDKQRVPAEYAEAVAAGQPFRSEYRLLARDGRTLWVSDEAAAVLNDAGRPVFYQGVILDLSRRKELEQHLRQAEKMASLGTLLGGLAHELNNPLFAISGYTQMLSEQVSRGEYEGMSEDLAAVRDAVKRATGIIERFLGQARPADGRRNRCEVNAVVKRALDLVANDFTIHRVRVETKFQPDLPMISADPNALSEVFLNLFTNARHAMVQAHGQGTLTVATGLSAPGPGVPQVEIRVTDDGPGIAPAQLDRIFDPFFTTKAVGEGTGLGLFICHQIVAEFGGLLTCESQPGAGATFIVRLPALQGDTTGKPNEVGKGGRRGNHSAG